MFAIGVLVGIGITWVVVMLSLVFAAKTYEPFHEILDRLIKWADRL